MLINAYFDESSEGGNQDGLLTVSGYALDLNGVESLDAEWKKMLETYNLDFFHMCECNANKGIFEKLSEEDCDDCAREAIGIARKYPLHGHAAILDQSEYKKILQDEGFDCDPYTFLIWCEYLWVNKWAMENRPEAKISLFFEDGYKTQPRADKLLAALKVDPRSGKNRLVSYRFLGKTESYPTQAADLIAWHIRKGYENKKYGRPIRKDTEALFEDRLTLTLEYTRERLIELRTGFINSHGTLENASVSLFAPVE